MNKSIALIIVIFLAGGARAGVYIEMSDHDVASGKMTARDSIYIQQGKARMEGAAGKRQMIFNGDAMIILDTSMKNYRIMDKAAAGQMAGQMNDMITKMKEQMASMPPEQRARMEKMMQNMGQGAPGAAAGAKTHSVDAVDTGGSGTANGRSCHLWNKTRDGVPEQQLCVVPAGALPGSDEVLTLMNKMSEFSQQFRDMMKAQGGAAGAIGSGTNNMMAQELAVLNKINGFPVATRQFTSGQLAPTEIVLTKWQQQNIPASQFEIPPGYTMKDMMESRKGGGAQ